MSLLGTATAWLVEPPDEPPDEPRVVAPADTTTVTGPPPSASEAPFSRIAVLGSPAAVPPLAAAVALGCRTRARVPSALVALLPALGEEDGDVGPGPSGPALPGAAGLATRLSRRGLPVKARGRLAWLALPSACDEAVTLLRHAEAAAADAPVVLAVARPRDPAVDALLAERELLVVAAPPGSPLAVAAGEDACGLRVPIRACAPLPPGALRLAALAGLRGPRVDLWSDPPATIVPLPGAAAERPRRRPSGAAGRAPGPAPSEEAW